MAVQTPQVTDAYINWLLTTNRAIMAHLYQFTAASPTPGLVGAFWARINGQNWNNNPLANPSTFTAGYTFGTLTTAMYPFGGEGTGFADDFPLTANFGASPFSYPIPVNFSAAGADLTWNPDDKWSSVGLINDNLTLVVASENNGCVRGTGILPTSGVYFEGIFPEQVTQDMIFGIGTATAPLNEGFGGPAIPGTVGLHQDGSITVDEAYYRNILPAVETGQTMGIAVAYGESTATPGPMDYFTDFDIDINYGGHVWKSGSLRFEGLHRKLGVGLAVDEQTLKIWSAPSDTIFGGLFLPNVEEGVLDGAQIVRYRIVWALVTGNVAEDIKQPPIAVWPLFTGYTSNVAKGGPSHVELKVKSALLKLNVNMPRNYYQPGCLWTLFDSGCTLLKGQYAVSGIVGASPSLQTIPVSGGIAVPTGADGIANFAQGRLQFTSGVNEGLQVLIDNNDGSNLYLAYVLNDLPSEGDTIVYYPGCSKAFNTCKAKFGNQANFRGFDKVPPVVLSM